MTEERIPPTQAAPQGPSVPETDWRAAGCSQLCQFGHTREWGVCAYSGGGTRSSSSTYRIVTFTAADGLPSMRFEPIEPEPRPTVWRRRDFWMGMAVGAAFETLVVLTFQLLGLI